MINAKQLILEEAEVDKRKDLLNGAISKSLGYTVLMCIHTSQFSFSDAISVWKNGEDHREVVAKLNISKEPRWESVGSFTRLELNIIKDLLVGGIDEA